MNNNKVTEAYKINRQALVDELDIIDRSIQAFSTSRLNNGILFIPEGLTVEPVEPEDVSIDIESADEYQLPFIIRGPDELLNQVEHITSNITPNLDVLRNRAQFIKNRVEWLDNLHEDVV